MQKTITTKKSDINRKWYVLDARDLVLGRLATKVAELLIGKNKQPATSRMDLGDYVVITNASKIAVTGNKLEQKKYYRHSGYPGGFRELPLKRRLENDASGVIIDAVKGMLPKNKMQSDRISRLFVFNDDKHDKEAQNPTEIKLK